MTYTPLLKELLNELKLARGKNCLIFAISGQPARLKEAIESANFKVSEIYLKGNERGGIEKNGRGFDNRRSYG